MAKKPEHFWIEPAVLAQRGIDFCSLETKGLWLTVMCLLHASERYGHLTRDGKPVSDEHAARRCGIGVEKWTALRDELLEFGLLKRSADGILFSPELVAQAEWRTGNAKRQKEFQDRKRRERTEKNNGEYNSEYNGYITPDITPNSHPNFKPEKPSSFSNEKKEGGGKPPAADYSQQNFCGSESLVEYLDRKQLEFPQHDVRAVYVDFYDKCGSDRYPKLRNTWRAFDRWISDQDVELGPLEQSEAGYQNPMSGKKLK